MFKENKTQQIESKKNKFFKAVARAITSIKHTDELLEVIVQIICSLMDVEKCSIQMLDEQTNTWRILGVDEARKGAIKNMPVTQESPISKWVKEKCLPLLVKDMDSDLRFKAYSAGKKKYKSSSFLLVPLKREGKITGIISTTDKKGAQSFDESDLELLSTLAEQVEFALESIRLSERMAYTKIVEKELKIAQLVQRDLLPKTLPDVSGISFSARISSAEMVAGDFYDVIFLDKNRIAIVVGDVEGKGIAAALLMVRVITLIRSEVYQDCQPAHVLSRLNTVLGFGGGAGLYVTLFYGVINIHTRQLVYSSAGHEFPLLYRKAADMVSEFKAGDPFLGSFVGIDYEQAQVQLKTGDRLVVFTDGAVEVQNQDGLMLGRETFKRLVQQYADNSGELLTQKLSEQILFWRGSRPQTDDLIILTASIDDPVKPLRQDLIKIQARLSLVNSVLEKVDQLTREIGFKEDDLFDIKYATAEAVENCIKHAKAQDDTINVHLLFGPDHNLAGQQDFVVIVQDEGMGFKVDEAALKPQDSFEQVTNDHGRGLLFMYSLMDDVQIRSKEGQGTEIRLMKVLK